MNDLESELKSLIVTTLELEDIEAGDIGSDDPLFGDGLGLDSIDALEIGLALQERYGVELDAEDESTREHFYSIATLSKLISNYTD